MISDVLSDAVHEIDGYLRDPVFNPVYKGQIRKDILALRDKMDALRAVLDALPVKGA